MTHREAIKTLQDIKHISFMDIYLDKNEKRFYMRMCEALDMAIKALEQTDKIEESHFLNELPKVTPQPKTGHWIMPQQDDGMSDPIYYQVRCSECGFDLDPQTWHQELHQYGADKYCPKCGAIMAESEDKE